jgi:hypothetical protein
MNDKQHILTRLLDIFTRWQLLLADLSEEQIMQPLVPSTWTVKDVIAHLWSWQQASVARAEAALQGTQPNYPGWWEINGPDPEKDVDQTNAWLYEASKGKPWSMVYADWKAQFELYLELNRQIPEEDLLEPGKFEWMRGYPLAASPLGSLGHHEEHFDTLVTWLQDDGR